MGKDSKIEWTDHTWNPWYGCHKISQGCKNCYMYRDMKCTPFDPFKVTRAKPATFNKPLHWKEPARVFTCSWSDFWIEEADEWREEALQIIAKTPHLTYQILTKRPERILDWLDEACWPISGCPIGIDGLPDNVWLGVSAENQEEYNKRVPYLLEIKASIRFVSIEPLLSPINIDDVVNAGMNLFYENYNPDNPENHWCEWCGGLVDYQAKNGHDCYDPSLGIDWVIVGGESGPNARPMHPDWVINIRDRCVEAGIPFFFKQWGEWLPVSEVYTEDGQDKINEYWYKETIQMQPNGAIPVWGKGTDYRYDYQPGPGSWHLAKVGKENAGRLLYGRTWDQFPNEEKIK